MIANCLFGNLNRTAVKYNIRIEKKGIFLIIFYISGERLFGYASPWYLFQYIGDPDELNLYKFTKLK